MEGGVEMNETETNLMARYSLHIVLRVSRSLHMPQWMEREVLRDPVGQWRHEIEKKYIMRELFIAGCKQCGLQTSAMETCEMPDKSRIILLGSIQCVGQTKYQESEDIRNQKKSLPIQKPNSISL